MLYWYPEQTGYRLYRNNEANATSVRRFVRPVIETPP